MTSVFGSWGRAVWVRRIGEGVKVWATSGYLDVGDGEGVSVAVRIKAVDVAVCAMEISTGVAVCPVQAVAKNAIQSSSMR